MNNVNKTGVVVNLSLFCLFLSQTCSNTVTAMKHILPIITLTTLAAAASAQSAAPAGLSYNRVGVSREGQNNNLSVSQLLGSSNVLVSLSTRSLAVDGAWTDNSNYTFLSVGYVLKNVAAGIDATLSVGAGDSSNNSALGINLRRSLSEIYAGLEVAVGYENRKGASGGANESAWTYELAYNINKQYSIAYGITDEKGAARNRNTVSVRYNF